MMMHSSIQEESSSSSYSSSSSSSSSTSSCVAVLIAYPGVGRFREKDPSLEKLLLEFARRRVFGELGWKKEDLRGWWLFFCSFLSEFHVKHVQHCP